MMLVIKAPKTGTYSRPWVFMAGSIEMGTASPWQDCLADMVAQKRTGTLFNPRRDDWDGSWRQSIHEPQFFEQVDWELTHLEAADLVVMYFDPRTKSPITLLELGLSARSGKLVVCCPVGFWRRGNVEIVCARYHVPMVAGLPQLAEAIVRVP